MNNAAIKTARTPSLLSQLIAGVVISVPNNAASEGASCAVANNLNHPYAFAGGASCTPNVYGYNFRNIHHTRAA